MKSVCSFCLCRLCIRTTADPIYAKFVGQGHNRSKSKIAGGSVLFPTESEKMKLLKPVKTEQQT